MKKIAILLIGISLTAGVMAQTDTKKAQTDPKKKAEMKDLRTDVREKNAASHQVNKDLGHVRIKKAIHDHKAVAQENKHIGRDSKALKSKGVSNPVAKPKRQGKGKNDNKKVHTN